MTRLVLDASVAVKWYLHEDHSADARAVLDGRTEFSVPDFFYAEVANVFWKRVRRKEITSARAAILFGMLSEVPIEIHETKPLTAGALDLAAASGVTVYDHLYLCLALREGLPLVTADRVFYDAVDAGEHHRSIVWVADAPSLLSRREQ